MASLVVAYMIWLVGGVFGLHHLYLGRWHHAFVWYSTLGGVFGLGWVRDIWWLPHYVRRSNADDKYQMDYLHRIKMNPKPSCSLIRMMGMFAMGCLLSFVFCGCLPNDQLDAQWFFSYRICKSVLINLGSSLGVYMVANVGELQSSWIYSVLGSLPYSTVFPENFIVATLSSTLVTWFGLRWKPTKPLKNDRKFMHRKFIMLTAVYTCLLCYSLYHNASITSNENKIPLKEAIRKVFDSPAWQTTKESMHRVYKTFMTDVWDHVLHDALHYVFHFSGIIKCLKGDAFETDITRACRKLLAENHPDMYRTRYEKGRAETRFIEIQVLCDRLYQFRVGRSIRN